MPKWFAFFALLIIIGFIIFETHDYPLFCWIFFSVFVYLLIIEICPTFGQFCLLIWKNEKTRVICKVGTYILILSCIMCDKNVSFDAKFERNLTLNMYHNIPKTAKKIWNSQNKGRTRRKMSWCTHLEYLLPFPYKTVAFSTLYPVEMNA